MQRQTEQNRNLTVIDAQTKVNNYMMTHMSKNYKETPANNQIIEIWGAYNEEYSLENVLSTGNTKSKRNRLKQRVAYLAIVVFCLLNYCFILLFSLRNNGFSHILKLTPCLSNCIALLEEK